MGEKAQDNPLVFDPKLLIVEDGTQGGEPKVPEGGAGGNQGGDNNKPPEKKEIDGDLKFDFELLHEDNIPDGDDDDKGKKKGDEDDIADENLHPNDIDDDDEGQDPSKDNKRAFSVVLGQDWVDGGVLTVFDEEEVAKIHEEEGEIAAIRHMMQKQIEASAEQIRSSYDQSYQDYLTLVNGGASQEAAVDLVGMENYVGQIKDLDLTKDDEDAVQNRKNLLTLAYQIETTWSADKISKQVDRMFDDGSDLEEIENAIKVVEGYVGDQKKAAVDKAKQDRINAEENYKKTMKGYKDHIDKTEEFFKGQPVPKATKEKMYKALSNNVQLQDGSVLPEVWAKRLDNPTDFDAKVAYLFAIGFFDDKPLDKLQKQAKTKATSELQNYLEDRAGQSYKSSTDRSFRGKGKKGNINPLDETLFNA